MTEPDNVKRCRKVFSHLYPSDKKECPICKKKNQSSPATKKKRREYHEYWATKRSDKRKEREKLYHRDRRANWTPERREEERLKTGERWARYQQRNGLRQPKAKVPKVVKPPVVCVSRPAVREKVTADLTERDIERQELLRVVAQAQKNDAKRKKVMVIA